MSFKGLIRLLWMYKSSVYVTPQYKEAFLKANPDYKWFNPEKHSGGGSSKPSTGRPSNVISAMLGGGSAQGSDTREDGSTITHKLAGMSSFNLLTL